MKKSAIALCAAALACACTQEEKTLVVYYSQTGNTKAVAELFAQNLDADLVELQCETPYPDDYGQTIEESRDECANETGRALVNGKMNLKKYSRIYIGYPVWYGTYAPPVVTFAKENDLAGKDVVLFCTYGSGGRISSMENFKKLCPEANVIGAFGIAGRRVEANAAREVEAFIAGLGSESGDLLGAYGEERPLDEMALEVFNKATEPYGYLNLVPVAVSSQVVAGINYKFHCTSQMGDGPAADVDMLVFSPLPGNGEPEVIEVIRR